MGRSIVSSSVLLALLATGCSDDTETLAAAFATPTGLTVAGTTRSRLFIANRAEDALQVMELKDDLDDLELVSAPAQFFPLRIPVGPGPTELVTTWDRRWVVVLNAVNQSLSLVDADSLRAVAENGGTLQRDLGGADAAPRGLVAPPVPTDCGEGCAGLVYVSLSGRGAVLELAVETADGPTLVPRRLFSTGGKPGALAIDPQGTILFASDGAAPEVIRVDLLGGAVDRVDIGLIGGPIAVTTDGEVVIVGRPEAQDVVILEGARSSVFAVRDSNPAWTPRPTCVAGCGATDSGICVNAHPSNGALCIDGEALRDNAEPYGALFLGGVPARILTLGRTAGEPPLTVPCAEEGDQLSIVTRTFSEFAVVALLNGQVYAIGIEDEETGELDPSHANIGWCRQPRLAFTPNPETLEEGTDQVTADTLITSCPEVPDRQRFACVEYEDVGVVTYPRETPSRPLSVRLAWEGLIHPALNAVTGGGELVRALGSRQSDRFFHEGLDFGRFDIREGDILEILSRPRTDDAGACRSALGGIDPDSLCPEEPTARCCALERRIAQVEDSNGRAVLRLAEPLPVDCFTPGAIRYRVRAGEQFMVIGTGRERLSPGELYGPAVGSGFQARLSFRMRDFDPHGELDACERYDEEGRALAPLDPTLRRYLDEGFAPGFEISHPFTVQPAGRSFSSTGSAVNAGSLPGGIVLAGLADQGPVVFVSYSASNALLGFVPFEAAYGAIIGTRQHRVIR